MHTAILSLWFKTLYRRIYNLLNYYLDELSSFHTPVYTLLTYDDYARSLFIYHFTDGVKTIEILG